MPDILLKELRAELSTLKAENESMKLDAERIDFMESHDMSAYILYCGKRWYWRKGFNKPHHRANSLREAIDAAMAQGEQG